MEFSNQLFKFEENNKERANRNFFFKIFKFQKQFLSIYESFCKIIQLNFVLFSFYELLKVYLL